MLFKDLTFWSIFPELSCGSKSLQEFLWNLQDNASFFFETGSQQAVQAGLVLTLQPRLVPNLQGSSRLSLPSAGVTGVRLQPQLVILMYIYRTQNSPGEVFQCTRAQHGENLGSVPSRKRRGKGNKREKEKGSMV